MNVWGSFICFVALLPSETGLARFFRLGLVGATENAELSGIAMAVVKVPRMRIMAR